MSTFLHEGDLPDDFAVEDSVAVDTETMGLNPLRDRLCLVQLSTGDGDAHLVRFKKGEYEGPNLKAILAEPGLVKLFHFARFDLAVLKHYLDVWAEPVYCTKIASMLARTFTDRHGLKDLCRELLDVEISKQQQSSDWGAKEISEAQKDYAASDVLYLHRLKATLDEMLVREGRMHLAEAAFGFLKTRAELDLLGWGENDIFAHS